MIQTDCHPCPTLGNTWAGSLLRSLATLPYRIRYGTPGWAEPPFGEGRLLEVGCGAGVFLGQMAGLGWRCWGIDPRPLAVAEARRRAPTAVIIQGTLEDAPFQRQFDLVVMSHVLEHLPNPVKILRRCHWLLAPEGKLFIGLPNLDSMEARLFPQSWQGLDIARHLTHFREPVIRNLLKGTGFTVLSARPSLFTSSISESLILLLPWPLRRRLYGSRAARVVHLCLTLPAAISYLLGNRGCLEIVAQKP